MRRALLLVLGCFELAAAGLLVFLGGQLPSTGDVQRSFSRAEGLTGESVTQYLTEHGAKAGAGGGGRGQAPR